MSSLTAALAVVSAVGSGVEAGVFFAFSTLVMASLAGLPARHGLAAMQAINAAAERPAFLLPLMGTTVANAGLAIAAGLEHGRSSALQLVGSGCFLVGVMGVTVAYHVPRNRALADLDPDTSPAPERWAGYVTGWTAMNHVRCLAALAAAAALTASLLTT